MYRHNAFRLIQHVAIVGSILGAPLASADVGFDVRIGAPLSSSSEYAPMHEDSVWIPGRWVWQDGERVWEQGQWEWEPRNDYAEIHHHDHWRHEHENNDEDEDEDER